MQQSLIKEKNYRIFLYPFGEYKLSFVEKEIIRKIPTASVILNFFLKFWNLNSENL